jgi:tetratricopeptide (TPR) repeat protein
MAKNNKPNKNETPKSNPTASKIPVENAAKSLENPKPISNYNWMAWFFALLGAGLYLNTLGHQFAFDDSIVITENSFTKQGFSGIYDLMTRDFFEGIYGEKGMDLTGGRYRPLSLILFAIEYQFFPGNPFIGHFINVLLYALTGMLLFVVLKNWLKRTEGGVVIAFIATLLFITHPIHTEAVANIKSRDEVLAFFLLLITLHGVYKAVYERSNKWYLIAMATFFLAMLSKENAFTYILLIPLMMYVLGQTKGEQAIKFSIPFWVLAVAYIGLRTAMLYKPGMEAAAENPDIMENPFVGADGGTRLATIGVILLHYLMLLFFPHPMSSDYSFNQIPWTSFSDPVALLGWGIYLGMGIYAAIKIWKRDVVALGILMYLAPLSLVINLFFNIGAPMADRFLYVPSFGFCLAIAYLLVKFTKVYQFETLKKNLPLSAGLLVVTLLCCGKTIARNPAWYNNEALFTQDINAAPNSAKIHYYYANTILKKFLDGSNTNNPTAADMQLLAEAEKHFTRSYEINPNFHHTTYNIGLVNIYKKNAQEALKWLNYTLKLQPQHGMSHEQLVRVYGELLNQPDKAMEHLNIVLSTVEGQSNASNYQHLGILHAMKGNVNEAEAAFLKAIEKDANMAKGCYSNLFGLFSNMAAQAKAQGDVQKEQEYAGKAAVYGGKAK